MNYNPYDMVPMIINGKEMNGRPFEFDSEIDNSFDMTNAFGNYVKPTKISTCCPDCGDGMEIKVSLLDDPPFDPIEANCQKCYPDRPDVVDPFMNPIESDRVAGYELDPLLHNPDEYVKKDKLTVSERLNKDAKKKTNSENASEDSGKSLKVKEAETSAADSEVEEKPKEKPKKTSKKSKAKKPKAKKAKTKKKVEPKAPPVEESNPHIEPADDISEEKDFDEGELAGLEELLDELEEDD